MSVGSAAQAGGLWGLDRGASNYARGGANIAAPRDPIAVYTNPAALAGQRGLQLMIDANAINDNRQFTRSRDALRARYDTVGNDVPMFPPSPGLFAAYNLASAGLEGLTLGGGVWGPVRSNTKWPYEGAQRYQTLESSNLQVHYGLSAAYALPWWGLKLGVTGMLIDQVVNTALTLALLPGVADETDAQVFLNAEHRRIPSAILGLSAQPLPFLVVGASYQLRYDVRARGDADIRLVGEDLEAFDLAVQGDKLKLALEMPDIFRVAAQYVDPNDDRYDVELAFVYETWSRNKNIRVTPQDISVTSSVTNADVTPFNIETNFRDTFSVRLGGRYDITPKFLTVRAGAYYERAAVLPQYLSASSFDTNRVGLTAGGRVNLPYGLWADIAAGYVMWATTTVDDSEVRLVDPLSGERLYPTANGTYENQQLYVLAAIGAALDL